MSPKFLRPCGAAFCPTLTSDPYCPEHSRARSRGYDRERGSASARGYDRSWRKVRERYLRSVGWRCERCGDRPIDSSRMHVHHRDRQPTGPNRFEFENLEALCAPCHNSLPEHRNATRFMAHSVLDPDHLERCRIAIAGYCRSGKTELAESIAGRLDMTVRHTDDLIGHGSRHFWEWGAGVSSWFDAPGPWLLEGVRVVNGLFHRMRRGKAPGADVVVWSMTPRVNLTEAQQDLNEKIAGARCMVEHWLATEGVAQYATG